MSTQQRPAIEVRGVSRNYRGTTALDAVTVSFEKDMIHGLLGRNGAGKTTLMSVITAQDRSSSGQVHVLGQTPYENEQVLPKICFVREEQKYVDDSKASHAFKAAAMAYPNWDWELADRLKQDFKVPQKTRIKKMSRGQRSAVGVIIGLASRAEVTFFDEPYMGLDAVAEISGTREVLHHEELGRMARTTVLGALSQAERHRVKELDLDVVPVSLQQLIVRMTEKQQEAAR